jgi:ketosteroid isomerase-like protein
MRTRFIALVPLLASAACQPAPETPAQMQARIDRESAAAREAIAVANTQFSQYVAAKQFDSLALLYAEDGRVMPPGEPTAVGRDAIARQMGQGAEMGEWALTLTAETVTANGPLAIERGTYTFAFTPGPNAPKEMAAMADTGKYLVHWKQVEGRWLLLNDIWNSNKPMPQ